jgi:DNA-binding HxlR family transcriptional regulator
MLKRDYAGQNCSIARALEILGERWTLLILRDAFLGLRRFDEFHASLGVARNVLATRLARLVDEGILEQALYSERPERYEYRLTAKGRELGIALAGLRQWGDKYLSVTPPRLLLRKSNHKPVIAAYVQEGERTLQPDELELVPGPGLATTAGERRRRSGGKRASSTRPGGPASGVSRPLAGLRRS